MRTTDIRARILLSIGATLASTAFSACGSTTNHSADAAADGRDAGKESSAAADGSDDTSVFSDSPFGAAGDGSSLSPRRPFLVGSSLRKAPTESRADWRKASDHAGGEPVVTAGIDAHTLDVLARVWLHDAAEEHASIAAFARFTMLLLSVGAPPDLVLASQRASIDEVHHARACFTLASRYGRRDVGPAPLVVHDAMGTYSLAELAALTAQEACVGETVGLVLATEQLAGATDALVVATLKRVVADEMRHAELGWSLCRWAIREGGEPVRRAIARAINDGIAATRRIREVDYGVDTAVFRAHGRLTCAEARAASERGIREIIEPCATALLSPTLNLSAS